MRSLGKVFKVIILLLCMIVILILGGLSIVFAEHSQKENIVAKELYVNINCDETYPGIDKIKDDDGWIYAYSVDNQVFTSETSEDVAYLKEANPVVDLLLKILLIKRAMLSC